MIKRKNELRIYKRLRPFIKGTVTAFAVMLVFSLLTSLCACVAGLSEENTVVPALITLCISSAAGGIITGSNKGRNGFFWGGVEGALLFLIILTTSLITDNADNGQLITKLLCCIISSVAGGIIGVNLRID
ncbi:MAG: TIGR04086 family membrane protein [Ruminiclostridium sp.]|nr:TIGR04086 family membrane protein [Ruminiclostridium sp.]